MDGPPHGFRGGPGLPPPGMMPPGMMPGPGFGMPPNMMVPPGMPHPAMGMPPGLMPPRGMVGGPPGMFPPGHGMPPGGPMGMGPPVMALIQPPKSSDPKDDPLNWKETKSENGDVYYYNTVTDDVSWEKPAGYIPEEERMKPLTTEKIGDTDWNVVFTVSGSTYYFNSVTEEVVWTLPDSLNTKKKLEEEKDKSEKEEKSGSELKEETQVKEEKSNEGENNENNVDKVDKMEAQDEESASKKRKADELSNSEEKPAKKPKIEEAPADKGNKDEFGDLSPEERVKLFKEMLKEKNIPRLSTWQKTMPLLVFDPRFKAISAPGDRQSVFESYMRNRAVDEKKEKQEALRVAKEQFQQLIDSVYEKLNYAVTFETLIDVVGDDARYKNIVDIDPREGMLILDKNLEPLKAGHRRKVKNCEEEFKELLKEMEDLNSKSSWTQTSKELAEWSDSRWHGDILTDKDREKVFREYCKELAKHEEEKRKKKERGEASKREREKAVQRMREQNERKVGRDREKFVKEEETMHFNALLSEKVQSGSSTRWSDVKRTLYKDKRYDTKILRSEDKERLFMDHLRGLEDNKEREFIKLLESTPKIEASTDWETARESLKSDPRFQALEKDRQRESIFDRYIRQLKVSLEKAFEKLLKELEDNQLKLEGEEDEEQHLSRATMDFLRRDKRWKNMDCLWEKREQLLRDFVRELIKAKTNPTK